MSRFQFVYLNNIFGWGVEDIKLWFESFWELRAWKLDLSDGILAVLSPWASSYYLQIGPVILGIYCKDKLREAVDNDY